MLIHMVRGNRASGTFHAVLPVRQHISRTVIALAQTSGDNARQTLMSLRQINDQHRMFPQFLLLDETNRLLDAFCGQLFALIIERHQLLRDLLCTPMIRLYEQLQCALCRVQPAGRIDAGTDHIADMIRAKLVCVETAARDQRL